MSDDYVFRVQLMDEIKKLNFHIEKLYSLVEGLERKKEEDENNAKTTN